MKDEGKLRHALAGYTGTERYYNHAIVRAFTYTDGVKAFAENAGNGAYRLLDILATEPAIRKAALAEGYLIARLAVGANDTATLTVAKDADEDKFIDVVYKRAIAFTDCPKGDWKFFITPNPLLGDGVITAMLPSEY